MTAAAIVAAGGSGQRMGAAVPKQFLPLAGVPLLVHSLRPFFFCPEISRVVLVVPAANLAEAGRIIDAFFPEGRRENAADCRVVAGGATRQESVAAGLAALDDMDADSIALVHDAARPLVTPEIIRRCLEAARRRGAAIVAVPAADTLKRVVEGQVMATVNRDVIWQAQTPQASRLDHLRHALRSAQDEGFDGTDESQLLECVGVPVEVVPGSPDNIKITRPEDLRLAETLLMQRQNVTPCAGPRIGHGYDAHRLVAGRPLVLGGVTVPHDRGLDGHSDADVITHALCDAILGALAAGDLGRHFPDSDPAYKGIDSLRLLEKVSQLARQRGFRLANADCTVVAQNPRLSPHIDAMRQRLAGACGVLPENIGVKATTTEKMGFPGREEGIGAHAVALLFPLEG